VPRHLRRFLTLGAFVKQPARLFAVSLAVLFGACADNAGDLLHPPSTLLGDVVLLADEIPPRSVDHGTQWTEKSDSELWIYMARNDSLATVGLKAPGARRGVWRGQVLLPVAGRMAGQRAVENVAGIEIIEQDTILPVIFVRVTGEQALARLRTLPFIDYVEPVHLRGQVGLGDAGSTSVAQNDEVGTMGSGGCGYNDWHGSANTTFAGDLLPPKFQHHAVQIDRVWVRATGAGVTIGITDTGVSFHQHHLVQRFAEPEGHSAGRWVWHDTVIFDGTQPIWHDECGHGTKMAGAAVAPMNGANVAGAAWRANLVSVRQANGVARVNSHDAILAIRVAASANFQIAPQRRIVVMAWESPDGSNLIADEIRHWYAHERLFIGASGTSLWGVSSSGVIFPAKMPEVVAVSGINDNYSASSAIHYGPQVELSFFLGQVTTGFSTDKIVSLGGSSGATAVVSGIAALIWSRYPDASRDWVRNRLRASGHIAPYHNNTVGYGVPNAMKAVGGMYAVRTDGPFWVDPYSTFTVTANPSGGTGPFSYIWSNGATTQSTSFTAGMSGTAVAYSLQVTDTYDGTVVSGEYTAYVEDRSGCDPNVFIC